MVGSLKGFGVLTSKKIGRFMETFDPRLRLMFAVRVLQKLNVDEFQIPQTAYGNRA
jgi:hypothetical protein